MTSQSFSSVAPTSSHQSSLHEQKVDPRDKQVSKSEMSKQLRNKMVEICAHIDELKDIKGKQQAFADELEFFIKTMKFVKENGSLYNLHCRYLTEKISVVEYLFTDKQKKLIVSVEHELPEFKKILDEQRAERDERDEAERDEALGDE
jgi:hypothetical protein